VTRTVAITGISGEIGSATAVAFQAAGWKVIGVDLVPAPSDIDLDGFEILDVGAANAEQQMTSFLDGYPSLDALVCAAGRQGTVTIDEAELLDWDGVLNANARGPFMAMKAAHPKLRASHGAIVNVASVHALATSIQAGPYAASKAALVSLTRAAALEWAPEVRVNALLPGAIDTPMLAEGLRRGSRGEATSALVRDELSRRIPLRRIGRPGEAAQAILFLADGDRSSYITGQALVADGGALAKLSTG